MRVEPGETGPSGRAAFAERYLEDYPVGEVTEFGGEFAVSADDIVSYAQRYDPQYFHLDAEAAAEGPFGGLVASGWQTAGAMMRLYVDQYLSQQASRGGPGIDELRWTAPVRPGDRLRLRTEVVEARPSSAKPDRGLLRTRVQLHNQDGTKVFDAVCMNIMRTRPRN
ncbi:MaoC family dehydratase [Nocardiopsis coralliicola]